MSSWKIDPKKCERLHPQLTSSCDSLLKKLGARGFEPRTSALSELRSNQLSYAPPTCEPLWLTADPSWRPNRGSRGGSMILSVAACSVQSRYAVSNESALFPVPPWTRLATASRCRTRKPELTATGGFKPCVGCCGAGRPDAAVPGSRRADPSTLSTESSRPEESAVRRRRSCGVP
jgi:hypothetical protein